MYRSGAQKKRSWWKYEHGVCLSTADSGASGCDCVRKADKVGRVLCACVKVTQSWSTLCNPMDYSPPAPLSLGFPRQECWSGLPFSPPGDRKCISCIGRWILYHWATWEAWWAFTAQLKWVSPHQGCSSQTERKTSVAVSQAQWYPEENSIFSSYVVCSIFSWLIYWGKKAQII